LLFHTHKGTSCAIQCATSLSFLGPHIMLIWFCRCFKIEMTLALQILVWKIFPCGSTSMRFLDIHLSVVVITWTSCGIHVFCIHVGGGVNTRSFCELEGYIMSKVSSFHKNLL
jgi:hypothetical protein